MRKEWIPLWITIIVWSIVGISLWVKGGYIVHKETGAWLNRAQVSSDAVDMNGYLQKLEEGMKEWGLTDGYAAFIFKTPENDMKLIMKAISKARIRLGELEKMSITSVEYQTGLDDVRGMLRELEPQAEYRYCIEHWLWFWYSVLFGWLLIIGALILGIILLEIEI